MKEADKKENIKKQLTKVKTYPVPYPKENISISTNNSSLNSKEELINQAFKFHSQGNIPEAIKHYKYVIDQGFTDPRVFTNYGVILQNIGQLKRAEVYHRKAIELKPDSAIAHSNLGNTLKDLGQLKDAEMSQRKAIELKPGISEVHLNLGSILKDLGKLKEAEISFRKSIELKPDFAEAYSNLGNILRDLGQWEEAEISTLKALDLRPNFAEALFNLSLMELTRGDYQIGLEHYEFRHKKKNPPLLYFTPKLEKLNVREFIEGVKLLVISEQGLGDTLQYMRYIPYLRNQGIDISFCPQIKLHSLIKASGIDQNPLTSDQAKNITEGPKLFSLCLKVIHK
ncbi:tetratricopeptide repeat protein, partial [Prochlorococcus marinus]